MVMLSVPKLFWDILLLFSLDKLNAVTRFTECKIWRNRINLLLPLNVYMVHYFTSFPVCENDIINETYCNATATCYMNKKK